jgi:glucosamine-6-phosphate deaminase
MGPAVRDRRTGRAAAPLVLAHPMRVALLAAELVANRLRARSALRLILPTGHTPLGMYTALRAHAADGSLPGEDATLFQLDEYVGLGPAHPQSYAAYLRRELEGVRFGTVHTLDGSRPDAAAQCAHHQALLDEAPIDLVVLGLGRDGHIAFDEPGSPADAGVRRVELHPTTRADAAADFGGLENVPREALTVGLRTLLEARELLMLTSGAAKADALSAMLEGPPGPHCPASLIRTHPRLTVICDEAAASRLTPLMGRSSDLVVIVLGHREPGVSAEDRISDESRARLETARRTIAADPPRAALFTGYSHTLDGLSEAEQMKADWDPSPTPTLLETAGRNTAENAARSLPLVRAIGEIGRVTVVTSAWHIRARYFFAPYRLLGLRLSFRLTLQRPTASALAEEVEGVLRMRRQRRQALGEMRLPPETALPPLEQRPNR